MSPPAHRSCHESSVAESRRWGGAMLMCTVSFITVILASLAAK